jgi:uncharacterized membrane protein (TIGR02234 family)
VSPVGAGDHRARRPLLFVLPACLAGSLAAFAAAQPAWVRIAVPRSRPLPDTAVEIAGRTLVPLVPALALVGLAAVLGLLGVRGRGRTAVGALLTLTGVAIAVAALTHLAAPSPAAVVELLIDNGPLPGRDFTRPATPEVAAAWPLLTAAGAVLLTVAGAWTALRGSRWAALSGRYDAAGARPSAVPAAATRQPEPTTAGLWDALDRGDDPTA